MNKYFLNLKAVELKEKDLDEHEKRFGIRFNHRDHQAILKYSGYRTALRFVNRWNTFSTTPVEVGIRPTEED